MAIMPTMNQAIDRLKTYSIADKTRTAVIIGGAQGIGRSVTPLMAKIGCSRIIVIGRNAIKGVGMAKSLASYAPEGAKVEVIFIQADVSEVAGMRKAVRDVGKMVGKEGVDYLFEFQNGIPTGKLDFTVDKIEYGFAVQAVSRFVVTELMVDGGYLAPAASVFWLANTGKDSQDLEVDDLNLQRRFENGKSFFGMFVDQSTRDSCVLDSAILGFKKRYPQYHFFHADTGLVRHDDFIVDGMPWQFKVLFLIGGWTIGTTADHIANLPVSTHSEEFEDASFLSRNMTKSEPSPWAIRNSEACWNQLVKMTRVGK